MTMTRAQARDHWRHLPATVKARVRRGAAVLDAHCSTAGGRRRWQDRIDLDTLELSDGCACVVAQLHGRSYLAGLDSLLDFGTGQPGAEGWYTMDADEREAATRWAELCGFNLPERGVSWNNLQRAWAALVTLERTP